MSKKARRLWTGLTELDVHGISRKHC
jgi:hypothetical protein